MPKILCFQQVRLLRKLFQRIERSKQQREFSNADNQALEQLVNALKLCEKHNLNMHVELLPAGNSDGNRWEMFAHCDNCKCVRTDASTGRCPGCNTTQQPCSARFQKVLGFRPYLRLKHVLGESNTVELVTSYLNHNK